MNLFDGLGICAGAFEGAPGNGEYCGGACSINGCAPGNGPFMPGGSLSQWQDVTVFFANTIFGDSVQLPFDGEGRVILPTHLITHANITEHAAFVGRGATFQIWQPDALHIFQAAARLRAQAARATLSLEPPKDAGDG